jgi:hypothetical protein
MIRIRNKDGSVVPVADGQFVELTSETGEVGMVVFQAGPVIHQVVPGSIDAGRYEYMFNRFGVKFNNMLIQRRP